MRMSLPKRSSFFFFAKFSMISTAAIFAGCQRIPDQSRVTKLDLVDIVRNIRCEFKEVLLNGYRDGDWLEQANITTKYSFTSTLNNDGDFIFTGFWPFKIGRKSGHSDGIIKADYDNTRKGITVVNFQEKYSNIKNNTDCISIKYYNSFKYPIKGKVGIESIVRKFHQTASIPGISNYETYTRELEFTVVKTGSLNPTYFLSPVPIKARTFDYSLTFSADRSDVHNVKITLSQPDLAYIAGKTGVPYAKIVPKVTLVELVGKKAEGQDGVPNPKRIPPKIVVVEDTNKKLTFDGEGSLIPDPRPTGIPGSGEKRALQRGIRNIDRQEDRFFREGLSDLLGR